MVINISVQYNGGFSLSLRNLVSGYECGRVFTAGGCRAGLTLKRCSQLTAFAIQPVG